MKCRECEPLLEELWDGELDARAAEAVRAHVAECAACAEAHGALAAEQSLYATYEREVEVTPQMWGRIEERIGAGPRVVGEMGLLRRISGWLAPLLTAPRFSPALTAALVVAAILVTIGATRFLDSRAGGNNQLATGNKGGSQTDGGAQTNGGGVGGAQASATAEPASAQPGAAPAPEQRVSPSPEQQLAPKQPAPREALVSGPPPKKGIREKLSPSAGVNGAQLQTASLEAKRPRGEQSPDQLVREAEKRYQAAIRILERDVKSRRSRLDAETLARFDETLASIDRTIAETRKAVRQQSNDPVAVQYMLSAYAKKVEVMREMAHIGQGN